MEQADILEKVASAGARALPSGAKPELAVLYEVQGEKAKWGSLWKHRNSYFVLSGKEKRPDVVEIDQSRAAEILGIAETLRSEHRGKERFVDPESKFGEITVYSFLPGGTKVDRVACHAKFRDELLDHGRVNEIEAGQVANALLGGGWLESRDLYVE